MASSDVRWARSGGYECSSAGDKRFSAFYAKLEDGRTIEAHYQCDVKGYQPGGTDWRLGKGKPPIREVDLWAEYLALWRRWAALNPDLLKELRRNAVRTGNVLSDNFATTDVNQAHALAVLLNDLAASEEDARKQRLLEAVQHFPTTAARQAALQGILIQDRTWVCCANCLSNDRTTGVCELHKIIPLPQYAVIGCPDWDGLPF